MLGQCKRFYAWAREQGYVTDNPFAAVKPIGRPRTGKAQLRIDEARRFVALTVARAQGGERPAIAALTALLLACSKGELMLQGDRVTPRAAAEGGAGQAFTCGGEGEGEEGEEETAPRHSGPAYPIVGGPDHCRRNARMWCSRCGAG